MKPFDNAPIHCPKKYRYAIEANQNWFEEKNITKGAEVLIFMFNDKGECIAY